MQTKHPVVRERFVGYAATYTHFFLCPTVYESELAKYLECAYAGSVPIGTPPKSLAADVKHCFVKWGGTTRELLRVVTSKLDDMRLLASEYRAIVRSLRDPEILIRNFEAQISKF